MELKSNGNAQHSKIWKCQPVLFGVVTNANAAADKNPEKGPTMTMCVAGDIERKRMRKRNNRKNASYRMSQTECIVSPSSA